MNIFTIELDIPNVIALKLGATSKWFAKWPQELKDKNAIQIDIIIIARTKLSTVINMSKNIAGPTSPIVVIKRLTEYTVQLLIIKESARCPAT